MQKEDLAKHTRKALLAIAKDHGLKGVSRLSKEALIKQLAQTLPSTSRALPRPSPVLAASSQLSSEKKQEAKSRSKKMTIPPPVGSASGRAFDSYTLAPVQEEIVTKCVADQNDSMSSSEGQAAAESKFFLGPQPGVAIAEPEALPASYSDNRIVLLARDPYWLYTYWDFSGAHLSTGQSQLTDNDPQLILRVFDITYLEFNGMNAWNVTDIHLTPFATNWYFAVPQAEAAYCVEIGYRSGTGQFASLGRSNVVTTPRSAVSLSRTVRWFTPPERRSTAQLTSHMPRSAFAHEASAHDPAPNNNAVWPSSSSREHPFSWGAGHKIAALPPTHKERE